MTTTTTDGATGRVQRQRKAPATQGAASPSAGTTPLAAPPNVPKRPKAGGKCAEVWDYLDANPETTAQQMREVAPSKGWNINNAVCELYAWRKFKGITGRVSKKA